MAFIAIISLVIVILWFVGWYILRSREIANEARNKKETKELKSEQKRSVQKDMEQQRRQDGSRY